ncbi:PEP/pyruvate-binding domain-containing protein [Peredibacter starrii]|uniref:PEP/pyruvate-binding domain-containing protein n=1 Tax=Peredibacter starrii TaxID=28202 RepID=A0AAX4HP00_9BACT|nr:PEP/pyruvate-binding domain-containing protein [Peredibacter starrii]WPU64987.1 PEP/pyruvate-binding domain-containing protein [Peredibacter starrii]
MNYISSQKELASVELVGGKGAHLQKLVHWGAPVASFFVLTTESFKYFLQHQKLPFEVETKFQEFFKAHPTIALRSSMISEDNADSSFAGLFETILDVTERTWKDSLFKIYASVHSDRVKEYIQKKDLKVDLLMAVVAQEQIQVEKSGVLFTRSPVEPTSVIAIDAAFGMGEGVVSGHAIVDHYQYTRNLELVSHLAQNDRAVLTESEIQELIGISLKMEKAIDLPSDIEWGFKDGKLYLFQIRPITRSFEPLKVFVDTNLSESYPGTVSPFSASFVKKAYENVFRESAVILGAHGKRLEILNRHYRNLISVVDDHLYYNLEHYYAVLRALPGGEKNIHNWHQMIGGKVSGVDIPHHDTELSKFETIVTIKTLLKLILHRKKIFGPLLMDFEKNHASIEADIKKLKSSKETIEYITGLMNRPLGFGLTIVNDIFVMMGLGILTKVLKKKGLPEDQVIDLLKTTEGVDSVKPLEHFNQVVSKLSEKFLEALAKSDLQIGFHPYENVFRHLKNKGFGEEVQALEEFLAKYGDRSFEELKLESLPMKNNPILVNQLLQWAKKNPSIIKPTHHKIYDIELSWIERKVVTFTQEAIAMREATRLWRGRYYHLYRQLVLKVGQDLMNENESWKLFGLLDFFSLSSAEWLSYASGAMSTEEAQTLISKRKSWQTKKQNYPEIIPWVETEALPKLSANTEMGALNGQGVSPGITEAEALVLENPNDALQSNLKEFILVTKNTDPAWVYIMSRSKGLISEKGSLLSHTAIIGRELNVPTIVGVKHATQKIKTGDRLRIDATKGTIEVL